MIETEVGLLYKHIHDELIEKLEEFNKSSIYKMGIHVKKSNGKTVTLYGKEYNFQHDLGLSMTIHHAAPIRDRPVGSLITIYNNDIVVYNFSISYEGAEGEGMHNYKLTDPDSINNTINAIFNWVALFEK